MKQAVKYKQIEVFQKSKIQVPVKIKQLFNFFLLFNLLILWEFLKTGLG